MLRFHVILPGVEVDDLYRLSESTLYLGSNDGGDLLRRPRRTSTPAVARGVRGHVEHVHGHSRFWHLTVPFVSRARYLTEIALPGHARTHTPQPAHISSRTVYPFAPGYKPPGSGTMAPVGHTCRAGHPGDRSQEAVSMFTMLNGVRSFRAGAAIRSPKPAVRCAEYTPWGIERQYHSPARYAPCRTARRVDRLRC